MRIGVIGAGGLGYHHIRILRDMQGPSFVGFYESRDRARGSRSRASSASRRSVARGVCSTRCDAVTIVVPTPAHYAVAQQALERGMHVLIEKPIATTLDEADEMLAAREAKRA